jgi:di/tricarboxylate transporter
VELFRVNRNAWGQEILVGISWDLIWLFAGAGVLAIAVHFLYMRLRAPKTENRE